MFGRSIVAARGRPQGPIDLLLRVGLAPVDRARLDWRNWSAESDFERVSRAETRLLAAFSERIALLDPSSNLLPRINGLAKLHWTKAQLTLGQVALALDQLSAASIPVMLFKGGALLAEDIPSSRRRAIGDVDILVPRTSAGEAIDVLTGNGWCAVNGESPQYLRRLAELRISGNYRKGLHGELDLHITPFHFSKDDDDLDQSMWRNARTGSIAGRAVLVPAVEDALIMSLAHAPISDSAEWALDVMVRFGGVPIDWDKVAHIAIRRGLVPPCYMGLRYLSDALEAPIPGDVIQGLGLARVSVGCWLKFWANVSDRRKRNITDKIANLGADYLLRREGFSHYVKDREAVIVSRPLRIARLLQWSGRSVSIPRPSVRTSHEFVIDKDVPGERLVIVISVLGPPVSRRLFFDVMANGVAIARLRCRLGPPTGVEKSLRFFLPKFRDEGTASRIEVQARPAGYLSANASKDECDERAAVPFSVDRVFVV